MTTSRRHSRLALVGLVAVQRLAELAWSRRNERRLRARGAVEHDRQGYPAMVALHVAWLTAMVAETSWAPLASRRWRRLALVGLLAAQPLRYWAIASLGDRWTTRVLVPPGEAPVETGPYRFLTHPNYVAVAVEIAAVPLTIGAWRTAVVASGLDALVLRRRIAVESPSALSARGRTRSPAGTSGGWSSGTCRR